MAASPRFRPLGAGGRADAARELGAVQPQPLVAQRAPMVALREVQVREVVDGAALGARRNESRPLEHLLVGLNGLRHISQRRVGRCLVAPEQCVFRSLCVFAEQAVDGRQGRFRLPVVDLAANHVEMLPEPPVERSPSHLAALGEAAARVFRATLGRCGDLRSGLRRTERRAGRLAQVRRQQSSAQGRARQGVFFLLEAQPCEAEVGGGQARLRDVGALGNHGFEGGAGARDVAVAVVGNR